MQNDLRVPLPAEPAALGGARIFRQLVIAMRPYQWVKNLFIFAPLLFGRKLTDVTAVGYALVAFVVFSFLASGLYIFNDWIDAEEDRKHPEKRNRPISSGALPVGAALTAAAVLTITAFALSAVISLKFLAVAALYFVLIVAYCFYLKKVIILDGMSIAAGFVLRVVAGSIAISVLPSHWLIVCTFLLALFLAFAKRRQELLSLSGDASAHRRVLDDYTVPYLEQVNIILIGATIVCYALYTVAPETVERFGTDALIYGTVFVIYGTLRYLALIEIPENGGNPTRLLLRDRPLALAILGWAAYNGVVIYFSGITKFLSGMFAA
jgi:4-hydroxybenzoate polyprenyltransferase